MTKDQIIDWALKGLVGVAVSYTSYMTATVDRAVSKVEERVSSLQERDA